MAELPLAAIKRLASVKGKGFRVGEDAVELIQKATEVWVTQLADEGFVFAIHAGRRTLKSVDIAAILDKIGLKIPAEKPKVAAKKKK